MDWSYTRSSLLSGTRRSAQSLPPKPDKVTMSRAMAGIDPHNIVAIESDEDALADEANEKTPIRRTRHATRQAVHGRQAALYDAKYHPMDEYIGRRRGRNSVKGRSATRDSKSDTSDDEGIMSVGDSNGGEDDSNDDANTGSCSRPCGARQSSRIATQQACSTNRPLYNQRIHPQDKALGIGRRRKKKPNQASKPKRPKVDNAVGTMDSGRQSDRLSDERDDDAIARARQIIQESILIGSSSDSDSHLGNADDETPVSLPYFEIVKDNAANNHARSENDWHSQHGTIHGSVYPDGFQYQDSDKHKDASIMHDDELRQLISDHIRNKTNGVEERRPSRADHHRSAGIASSSSFSSAFEMMADREPEVDQKAENYARIGAAIKPVQSDRLQSALSLKEQVEHALHAPTDTLLHQIINWDAVDTSLPAPDVEPPPSSAPSIGQLRYGETSVQRALRDVTKQIAQRDNVTKQTAQRKHVGNNDGIYSEHQTSQSLSTASSGFTAINSTPLGPTAMVTLDGQIRLLSPSSQATTPVAIAAASSGAKATTGQDALW